MALLRAIGTSVLAAFAVVTAWYARKAFREQSREVAAIEQQVKARACPGRTQAHQELPVPAMITTTGYSTV